MYAKCSVRNECHERKADLTKLRREFEHQLQRWRRESADARQSIADLGHDLGELQADLDSQAAQWQKVRLSQIISNNLRIFKDQELGRWPYLLK